MAAPPLVPDDAPTTPIQVADLRRTTRRRTPLIVVGAAVVALMALGSIVVARSSTPAPDRRDVLLVVLRSGPNAPFPATGFTAYDLAGHRLWSLPDGDARGICAIDRGILLLRGSGLATVDPVTGHQLSVDQGGDCPQVVAGLAVTSHQDSPVWSTAEDTVTVLRQP